VGWHERMCTRDVPGQPTNHSLRRAAACGGVVQLRRGLSAIMEVTGSSQPKVVVLLVVCVDRCTAGLKSLL
jgi:hypothetical protein